MLRRFNNNDSWANLVKDSQKAKLEPWESNKEVVDRPRPRTRL